MDDMASVPREPVEKEWKYQKSATYNLIMRGMLQDYRNGRYEKAEDTAAHLLEQSDVPIVVECISHMVFGSRLNTFALDHAREAVRLLESNRDRVPAAQFPEKLYGRALSLLRDAERSHVKILEQAQTADKTEEEEPESNEEQEQESTAVHTDAPVNADASRQMPGAFLRPRDPQLTPDVADDALDEGNGQNDSQNDDQVEEQGAGDAQQ